MIFLHLPPLLSKSRQKEVTLQDFLNVKATAPSAVRILESSGRLQFISEILEKNLTGQKNASIIYGSAYKKIPNSYRHNLQLEGGWSDMSNVVVKENESLDSALRRFKRSCAKAGIMQEVRKREHYEKPSVKRKKKSEAARKRKFN